MITVIRSYFKRGSQVILWLIVVAFVVGLMPLAMRQVTKSGQWAMRVNGQDIEQYTFSLEVAKQRERIAAFRAQYGEYADWLLSSMDALNPQSVALRTLARQELLNQFSDTLGMYVSPEYVMSRMCDPSFAQNELTKIVPMQLFDQMGNINQAMLAKYLRHYGMTAEMFERQIERALAEKLTMDMVMATFYLPSFDLKQRLSSELSKKNFSIIEFPFAALVAQEKKTALSDEEIKKFYDEQNQQMKRYWVPELRSATVWTFDPKTYGVAITDAQINDYYERHKASVYVDQPATVQVRRILFTVSSQAQRASVQEKAARVKDELINKPGSFAQIAKTVSDDQESAKNGGLMAPFKRGEQEAVIDRAAFLLPEDGALSDVLETSKGYEILQRVNKKQQTFKSLASVRDEIRKTISEKKFSELFSHDAKQIMERAKAVAQDAEAATSDKTADSILKKFAKDRGGKTTFVADKPLDNTQLMQNIFARDSDDSSAIQLASFIEDDKGVLVLVTAVKTAHLPALNAVKTQVAQDMYEQRAHDRMQETLKNAKRELGSSSLDAIKKKYNGELIKAGWLNAGKQEAAQALEKKGVPVAEMLQLEKSGAVITRMAENAGFLIKLDEIAPLSGEEFDKKKDEISQQFQEERMSQYQEGFIASLYRNARIETNESVVTFQE